jgi:hypothetical protein
MKIETIRILAFTGLLFAGGAWLLQAQSYSADWQLISGGGGTSSNGSLTLTGTIGQWGAGILSEGSVTVESGFWNLSPVAPNIGAPVLSIAMTSSNTIVVSWPLSVTGFTLQSASNLSTSNWLNYGGLVVSNSATLSPAVGTQYYRLFKP